MFFQVCVDSKVVGHVKQHVITVASASKVIIHTMQDLMTKQEFNFFGFEQVDETTVIVKITPVCGRSATPFVSVH